MKYPEDFSVVAVVQGELRASVSKSHLESAGIPVLLEYESAGKVIGINIDGLGEVRVLVPKTLANEARQVLGLGINPKSEVGHHLDFLTIPSFSSPLNRVQMSAIVSGRDPLRGGRP